MKKITLLTIILIIGVLIIVGCSNTVMESPVNLDTEEDLLEELPNGEVMMVGYSSEDKEEIFGDISMEEIDSIIDKIVKEVSEDKIYEDNIDSIIEKAFKESGINDTERVEAAKSKITISKQGSLTIKYDVNIEKEIFGELSKDEITSVFTDIAAEIYEDEDYENNLDSIIEKVFREAGIDDPSKLNAAKSTITVSYSNSK